MAFLLDGKTIQQGTPFTDAEGNQYPANWLELSTADEKKAIGIVEKTDPVRADDRFYWDGDIANPKDLDGLQTQFIAQIKDTTNKLLAQSDWYVIRKLDRNIDIPTDIQDKRNAIIIESNRLETAILAVADVEALIEVLNTQNFQ